MLAVAFTGWELRARAPMLPMRLFAIRGFSAGNAVAFLMNASLTGAGGYTSAAAFSAGFAPAITAVNGLALAGALAGLALPGRSGQAQDTPAEQAAAVHQARTADSVAAGR